MIREIQREIGSSLLFVTHDLARACQSLSTGSV